MAKVAVIYVEKTKHILACVTTLAGDPDPQTPVADLVGGGIPLRSSSTGGPVVFFPSDSQRLKVAVLEVQRSNLVDLLAAPQSYSISGSPLTLSARNTDATSVVLNPKTPPFPSLSFTYTASSNPGPLNCICAVQSNVNSLGKTNPATLAVDTLTSTSVSSPFAYSMHVSTQANDAFVLLVEGVSPVIP
jgi:hypothetical protein